MSYLNNISGSEQSSLEQIKHDFCCSKTLGVALLIIATVGGLIAIGIGVGGLGAFKGWWSAGALSHLGQFHSWVLIGLGGAAVTACLMILLVIKIKKCLADQQIVDSSYPLETQSEEFKLMQKGLQEWVDQVIEEERKVRLKAANKIIDCFQCQSSKLDLSCSGKLLTSLPKEIGELTQLKELGLANNGLTSLPQEMDRLVNLEELDLWINQFDSFPLVLCNLVNLKKLNLNENGITSLPTEFGNLVNFEVLNLAGNCFDSFPFALCDLINLKELNLNLNRIVSLPSELDNLSNLRYLGLIGNELTTLPAEIGCLTSLRNLLVNTNRLTSLPNEILTLPPTTQIDLQGNRLSQHVIENLQQIMNADGFVGPRITFSMPRESIEEQTLEQLLKGLFQAAEKPSFELSNLCAQESDAENLKNWLSRLSAIGDYKTKRKELSLLIYQVLAKAEKQSAFRDTFWSCIDQAHETCGDRMALSILYLDIQFQITECAAGNDLAKLAYLIGHGTWAISQLDNIAGNKARSLRFVDEIEVYLAYPIALKQELLIPITLDTMLYFKLSSVTRGDLQNANEFVKSGLSNKRSYCDYLASDLTWQTALEKARPKEYEKIQQEKESALDTAVSNADYEKIDIKFKKRLSLLTSDVLDQVGLPPFLRQTS